MIDCRTQHGTWRVGVNPIIDIGECLLGVCGYSLLPNGDKSFYWTNEYVIKFYDLNGNYTGFRLKQLK
jgi:hypothetical protein